MGRRSKVELVERYAGGKGIQLSPSDIGLISCPVEKTQHIVWDSVVPGLGVRVSAGGRKAFVLKKTLTINGQRKVFKESLGSCVGLSLDEARSQAVNIIKQSGQTGLTPAEVREQEALIERERLLALEESRRLELKKVEDQEKFTLGALCLAYADHLKANGKISHASVRSMLRLHVIDAHPELARLPAGEVTRVQIGQILESMLKKGVKASVSRLRSYLVSAFNLAISVDGDVMARQFFSGFKIESNPAQLTAARSLRRLCGVRNRVLDEDEVKFLFETICGLEEGPVRDVLIMNFYLGGQRISQLLRVKREHLDLRAETITLFDPKGNRDRPRLHVLPLVGPALKYAQNLDYKAWQVGSEYLFSSEVLRKQHVVGDLISRVASDIAKQLLSDNKVRMKFTIADLRRTVETTLARFKISMEVRGQLQSHGLSGVQIRHYDRHDYMDEKREAIEIWQGVFLKYFCPLM